jgi:hypothetical protein
MEGLLEYMAPRAVYVAKQDACGDEENTMSDRSLRGRVAVAGVGETVYYRHGQAPEPAFVLCLKTPGSIRGLERWLGPYLRVLGQKAR